MEWTIPAFAFPAEAGTRLPTPEGWNAELALGILFVLQENLLYRWAQASLCTGKCVTECY